MSQLPQSLRPYSTPAAGAPLHRPHPYRPAAEEPDGIPVDVPQLIRALLRKWWVVGLAGVIGAGGAIYWARGIAYQYQARALVQLVPSRQALTAGIAGTGSDFTSQDLYAQLSLPQLEVVQSAAVVGAVVDSEPLGLRVHATGFPESLLTNVTLDPAAPAAYVPVRFAPSGVLFGTSTSPVPYGSPMAVGGLRFTITGAPTPTDSRADETPAITVLGRDLAVDRVRAGIRGRGREKSTLIDITYTSIDPSLAQRVVNRTAYAFQEEAARRAQQQSRRRRVFIEEQLGRVDAQLQGAELSLSGFRARQQAFSTTDKFIGQQKDLTELTLRERDLQSSRAFVRDVLTESEQGTPQARAMVLRTLRSAPGLSGNTVITSLVQRLVGYESSRSELIDGDGYTSREPKVIRLDSLISATQQSLTNTLRSHVAMLDAQLLTVQAERRARERELALLPSANAQEARLGQNEVALREQSSLLRTEYQRARIAEAAEIGPVEILNLESRPRPLGRESTRVIILATLLGLGAGVVLVAIPVIRDRSLKRRRDVENAVRLPVLATIPRIERDPTRRRWLPSRQSRGTSGPAAAGRPRPQAAAARGVALATRDVQMFPGAEAYRHLRATLFSTRFGQAPRKLLVTSALPSEGKTSVATNLATTLARQGFQVLLIDCDLRNGKLHRIFDLSIAPGLTDALRGTDSPLELLRRDEASGVFVMTAGTPDAGSSDLLSGPRLRAMLNDFAQRFDAVIIDSSPVLAVSDSAAMSAAVDAVLLVVRAGQTTGLEATAAARQLTQSGAPLAGVALNDPDNELMDEPSSSYYYAYSAAG